MPKKMTIEDVKKILPTLEILSDVYIYAHANLCYKCECGEIHEAYYSNLAAGKRHDFCKHKQNLRDEQKYIKLKSMMEKEGYKLLGVKFEGRDGNYIC